MMPPIRNNPVFAKNLSEVSKTRWKRNKNENVLFINVFDNKKEFIRKGEGIKHNDIKVSLKFTLKLVQKTK